MRYFVMGREFSRQLRNSSVSDAIAVQTLQAVGEREIQELSDVLIDCVEGGASVSFMLPIERATAVAFWRGV